MVEDVAPDDDPEDMFEPDMLDDGMDDAGMLEPGMLDPAVAELGCASEAVPDCEAVPAEVVMDGEPVESRPAVEDMLGCEGVSWATAAPANRAAAAAAAMNI